MFFFIDYYLKIDSNNLKYYLIMTPNQVSSLKLAKLDISTFIKTIILN